VPPFSTGRRNAEILVVERFNYGHCHFQVLIILGRWNIEKLTSLLISKHHNASREDDDIIFSKSYLVDQDDARAV